MKKIIVIVFYLFFFHSAFSQSDFREAFIVTYEGDSLTGFVDYSESSKNYESCDFKKTLNQDVVTYSPNQLAGYRFINDKYFESKIIGGDSYLRESHFLEVLVKGKASLFKYNNRYFISKDTLFYELENTREIIEVEGKNYKKRSNDYFGKLSYLLSDCKNIQAEMEDLEFKKVQLSELIENYNNCIGESTVSYLKKQPAVKAVIGADLGFVTSSLKLSSENYLEYLTGNYNNDYSFGFGVNLKINIPKFSERLFIYTGVYYLKSNFSSTTEQKYSMYYIFQNEVFIDIAQLKIPFGFGYTFYKNNIGTPFFNLGILVSRNIKTNSYRIREVEEFFVLQPIETIEDIFGADKAAIGYWGGIGLKRQIKNGMGVSLEMRYEFITGEVWGETTFDLTQGKMDSKVQNIQILLGISF